MAMVIVTCLFLNLLMLCSCWAASRAAANESNAYLLELQQSARSKRLWEHRQWQVLMHYRPRLLGLGVQSQVDDPSFFLSPSGKFDPRAELDATLTSFFAPAVPEEEGEHPQCEFIARYHWLKQELGFNTERLEEYDCLRFDDWLDEMDPGAVTLVFPVAYLNNPASMFGHTLLRVDTNTSSAQTRLLDFTINYAASTEQERGLSFALKGLFGGYQGSFSVAPYHVQVKRYGDVENRDIWEYKLAMTDREVLRMLMHAWELKSAYFDYYFLDENCSYHLLSLLEAARPSLHLLDQFGLWAVPADTVRAVAEVNDLISHVTFRPSRRTVLQARIKNLAPELQNLAKCIGDVQCPVDSVARTHLSPLDQSKVLELAMEYVAYQHAKEKEDTAENDPRLTPILTARSKLDIPPQSPRIEKPSVRPDQGHPSSRAEITYGGEDGMRFFQLSLRPVLHDLIDPPGGYINGAQLEFLDMAARYYVSDKSLSLEYLDIVDIVSIPIRSRFIKPLSWKASAGLKRFRFDDEDRPITGQVNVGTGLSYTVAQTATIFIFAEATGLISDRFDEKLALGAGPSCGVIVELTDNWRIALLGRAQAFFLGSSRLTYDLALEQSIDLTQRSGLRIRVSQNQAFADSTTSASIGYLVYF
jgi:hypothetical protein